MGLVTRVEDDALAAAMAWAADVAAGCSPSAMAVMKRQLLEVDGQDLTAAVESSLVEMRAAFQRPDLTEAIMARLEKRAVDFPPYPAG
jgi:enoyl-CoA hydratase/carnithine racemase